MIPVVSQGSVRGRTWSTIITDPHLRDGFYLRRRTIRTNVERCLTVFFFGFQTTDIESPTPQLLQLHAMSITSTSIAHRILWTRSISKRLVSSSTIRDQRRKSRTHSSVSRSLTSLPPSQNGRHSQFTGKDVPSWRNVIIFMSVLILEYKFCKV